MKRNRRSLDGLSLQRRTNLIELMLNMHQKDKNLIKKLTNTKLCVFYVRNFMFVRNPIRVDRTRTPRSMQAIL